MLDEAALTSGRTGDWESIPGLPANAFVANEARWFALDAVYLVFVLPGVLVGAKVSGQMILGHTLGFFSPENPLAFTRADLLLAALVTDPTSNEFLSLDPVNFRLTPADIVVIRTSAGRSLWTGGVKNSGKLTLVRSEGRTRSLILLGQQDLNQIRELLIDAGFVVE